MAATVFWQPRRYRVLHFGVTVLYTGLNLIHLVMDLFVQPIAWCQIALMAFLVVIGLILNRVAYQWIQSAKLHARPRLHHQTLSDELRIR